MSNQYESLPEGGITPVLNEKNPVNHKVILPCIWIGFLYQKRSIPV